MNDPLLVLAYASLIGAGISTMIGVWCILSEVKRIREYFVKEPEEFTGPNRMQSLLDGTYPLSREDEERKEESDERTS